MQRAVKAQNDPLMEYLLMHGADPNQGQRLPLVTAVKNERLYVIEILLDFGADPGLDDFKGESPMDVAKNSGNRELLNRLRRASR